MEQTRRHFLGQSLALGGLAVVPTQGRISGLVPRIEKSPEPLSLLFLGGTGFLGPHQVEYALQRDHRVTLFNRGKTNPHLFPGVEKLKGDRNDNLEALKNRHWDAVIDNSASIPRWVRQSAGLLKGAVNRYLFVSSISVYADNSIIGIDETDRVGTIADPTTEEITGTTYGPLKALCEKEAQNAFPESSLIVRPGLIVGPMDRSDRFTYWPVRINRGGEVLAPGKPADPVQIVDVRDLGAWMIRMIEEEASGVFNATGPQSPLSMAEMLYGIRAVTASRLSFTWIEAEFLAQHQVKPWSDMPVWVPPTAGMEGFSRVNCDRAFARGLTFRPLAETAADTLLWFQEQSVERRKGMRSGLSADREAEVLAAWHRRSVR